MAGNYTGGLNLRRLTVLRMKKVPNSAVRPAAAAAAARTPPRRTAAGPGTRRRAGRGPLPGPRRGLPRRRVSRPAGRSGNRVGRLKDSSSAILLYGSGANKVGSEQWELLSTKEGD